MLWSIKKCFQDGTVVNEIISSPKPYIINLKKEKVVSSMTKVHKYDYEHIYPPTFYTDGNGDKFIMPLNIKCHPDTTVDDINWIKPKTKEVVEKNIFKFKSKSDSSVEYIVRQLGDKYKCNCPGFWRAKGKCKHVVELEKLSK